MNKLLFISNNLADVEKVKHFAKKNHFSLEHYSKEEWKAFNKKLAKKNLKKVNNTNDHSLSIIKMPTSRNNIQTMDEVQSEAIRTALLQSRGNASKAAETLQIGRATLYRKLDEFGMNIESMRKSIAETDYHPSPLKKSA